MDHCSIDTKASAQRILLPPVQMVRHIMLTLYWWRNISVLWLWNYTVQTTQPAAPTTTTTAAPTTTKQAVVDPTLSCNGHPHGSLYSDPLSCFNFYQCSNGRAYLFVRFYILKEIIIQMDIINRFFIILVGLPVVVGFQPFDMDVRLPSKRQRMLKFNKQLSVSSQRLNIYSK